MPADWARHKYHLAHVSGETTIARTGPAGRYVYSVWRRTPGDGDNGRGWRCLGHYATAAEAKTAAERK